MKKLLTVLLAMAIVCTYSIPAVFADTTTSVSDAQTAMATAVDTYYASNVIYNQSGKLVSVNGKTTLTVANDGVDYTVDTNLTKAAVDATIAKLKADYNTKIANAYVAGTDVTTAWTADIDSTGSGIVALIFGAKYGADNGYLYTTAVAAAKTAAQAAMDAVDTSLYTSADAKLINNGDGNTAVAAPANYNYGKLYLSNAINAITTSTKADLATILSDVANFNAYVGTFTKAASQSSALEKYKSTKEAAVATLAENFTANEKARLEKIVADTAQPASTIADATAKLASLTTNVAAAQKLIVDQIEAVSLDDYSLSDAEDAIDTLLSNVGLPYGATQVFAYTYVTPDATANANAAVAASPTTFYTEIAGIANVAMLNSYAESYATGLKNKYDSNTGLAMYNATSVDAVLTDVKALIKNLDPSVDTYAEIESYFGSHVVLASAEAATLKNFKSDAIDVITKASGFGNLSGKAGAGSTLAGLQGTDGKYLASNWSDSDKVSDIEAIQTAYKAKINAATSMADIIALVKEAEAKMDAVGLTNAQRSALTSTITANIHTLGYADNANGTGGTIASYADSKGSAYAKAKAAAEAAAADVLYEAVYAKNNTKLTNAEIQQILKDNYAAALAKIDAMKTDAELSTAANALVTAINALPTTVTLADKDKYLAVEKQYEDYLANAGTSMADISNYYLLDTYMTKLIKLERQAAEALVAALPTTISVDNKDAVEAARKAVDAYADAYSKYDAGNYDYDYTPVTNLAKLSTAETNLADAMMTDAAKKIAALPALPTLADADAIKAARTAYDSLTDLQKSTFSSALVAKLTAAEKALNAEKIAATQSLKLTAKSAAVKGKMTITWKVNGTVVTGVKYQVMRSQHKNYGYKYMKTTSLKKYVNTKNLKAGKTYYYKVRAYITVDGVKYFSDWSNKAFRTAK